ncbi:hypothetical protein AB0N21_07515 [Streptomyces sp. NPDC051080]|uniref:hypothetical protein n=1 Tax=Streptomyces sp. NPDC051080 TaxID=3157222 RepID=UPI003433547E
MDAPAGARDVEHHCLGHARAPPQRRLHLAGLDALSARLHLAFQPALMDQRPCSRVARSPGRYH